MIYRDDRLACEARIRSLEAELKALKHESRTRVTRSLRQRLKHEHRALIWAQRRMAQRIGWIVPRSMSELMVALGVAMICVTLAAGALFIVACVVSIA